MGIGNITELTAADSTGVNALLIAICQELGIRAVLTTEVIPWAHGSVREIDIARRLMYHAVTKKVVPKRIDDRLVTVKDPKILEYGEAELRELQSRITDPNFRIFTDRDTITVLNRDLFVRGTDIQEIFSQLGVDEATHAFYLGKELAKAKLAITLGKTYRQEGSLSWGYLTPPDDVKSEHVKLTQRSRRRAAPEGGSPASMSAPLVEELVPVPDPIESCARFRGMPYLLFLDSARDPARLGRYSFLAADPALVVHGKGSHALVLDTRTGTRDAARIARARRGARAARAASRRAGQWAAAIPGRRRRLSRVRLGRSAGTPPLASLRRSRDPRRGLSRSTTG